MPEISNFIHGNKFLMNRIVIELLLTKNPPLTEEIWIFTC